MAVAVARVLLLFALLAPALSFGAGLGAMGQATKGFRSGKYVNASASIASIGVMELTHASKADNVEGLLRLARMERKGSLTEIEEMQAWQKYNSLPDGDRLLLRCLKAPQCSPLPYVDSAAAKFAKVRNGERLLAACLHNSECEPLTCADIALVSELHREVVMRQPGRSLAQANQMVGEISEQVMVRHFESTGWQRIDGQIGRSGIDGLFVKRNSEGAIREVLVAESKYNSGTLQLTNHGEQMSRDWVERKVQQLRMRQPDSEIYRRVDELINQGFYRARLWTMRVSDDEIRIDLQRVRSASSKVDELIDDPGTRVQPPPLISRISAPKDSFQRTIVAAYQTELAKLGPAQ